MPITILSTDFKEKVQILLDKHQQLVSRKNEPATDGNGVYQRWKYPVVTAAHTPVFWRYDFDEARNPYLMERQGVINLYA